MSKALVASKQEDLIYSIKVNIKQIELKSECGQALSFSK